MKKNFLVTAGIKETWEFHEKNFLLGEWCKFNFQEEGSPEQKILENTTTIKNEYHFSDGEKRIKDYKYLKNKIEYLLEVISEKLSKIHKVDENKEYWRVIIFNWLSEYTTTIYNRWESIRIFFERNNSEKFYSNFIMLDDLNYIQENHANFMKITQKDEWNHMIFLRILNFLNFSNLSLIEKKNNINKMGSLDTFKANSLISPIRLIDNIISKIAFKFNNIIFESFYFPKKEFIKICLRCRLIPSKYLNFFDFKVKNNILSEVNNKKRIELKNLFTNIESQDKFIQFLLLNIYRDMPKSYLENFNAIKKKISPLAKEKKVIFSMYSLERNDNFKIYIAETKKVGSKLIHIEHGGGLSGGFASTMHALFDFFEKVPDKVIRRDNIKQKTNIYENLSPIVPIMKFKNFKRGSNCSIIFVEAAKYERKFQVGPAFDQQINFFNELTNFVNKLNPEIKSKVKFRTKENLGINSENIFFKMFGKNSIDKISTTNTFEKTILNSKLLIITYPETVFSEAMYSNIPTILIIKKKHYLFSEIALETFNLLKKNKIAFEDFNEAQIHINKNWKEIDLWWKLKNVQLARKMFLKNFFNIKSEWFKEWSDYIYYAKKL